MGYKSSPYRKGYRSSYTVKAVSVTLSATAGFTLNPSGHAMFVQDTSIGATSWDYETLDLSGQVPGQGVLSDPTNNSPIIYYDNVTPPLVEQIQQTVGPGGDSTRREITWDGTNTSEYTGNPVCVLDALGSGDIGTATLGLELIHSTYDTGSPNTTPKIADFVVNAPTPFDLGQIGGVSFVNPTNLGFTAGLNTLSVTLTDWVGQTSDCGNVSFWLGIDGNIVNIDGSTPNTPIAVLLPMSTTDIGGDSIYPDSTGSSNGAGISYTFTTEYGSSTYGTIGSTGIYIGGYTDGDYTIYLTVADNTGLSASTPPQTFSVVSGLLTKINGMVRPPDVGVNVPLNQLYGSSTLVIDAVLFSGDETVSPMTYTYRINGTNVITTTDTTFTQNTLTDGTLNVDIIGTQWDGQSNQSSSVTVEVYLDMVTSIAGITKAAAPTGFVILSGIGTSILKYDVSSSTVDTTYGSPRWTYTDDNGAYDPGSNSTYDVSSYIDNDHQVQIIIVQWDGQTSYSTQVHFTTVGGVITNIF